MMLAFGIFGAAMFAEPAVAEIEKVIGLIQVKRASQCRVSVVQEPAPDHGKVGRY